MNMTPIKGALAVLVLLVCGCTDHGPVGLYSKELFNKDIAPPHLTYYSSSTSTIIGSAGPGNNSTNPQGIVVNIRNDGGSSTYGPISISFTCVSNDLEFVMLGSAPGNTGPVMAYCANNPGQEIPASASASLPGQAGYNVGSTIYITDTTYSFHFYCNVLTNGSTYSPQINMQIKDPLGNTWNSQFTLTFIN